jgi:hypothetical protein
LCGISSPGGSAIVAALCATIARRGVHWIYQALRLSTHPCEVRTMAKGNNAQNKDKKKAKANPKKEAKDTTTKPITPKKK